MKISQDMNVLKFFIETAQKVLERENKQMKHLTLNKWPIGYNLVKGCH